MAHIISKILIILVAITILGLLGYFYLESSKEIPIPQESPKSVVEVLETIAEVSEVKTPKNPLQNQVPEVNPVNKTNPFNTYKNPF